MAASVASADHGNDCNPTQLPSPQVARRLEFSRSRSSLRVTHYEEVGTVNATGQRHLGQRVRAHALTRGLAVHGVCTASQLRFQRGSKACVHGATCVQGVCARCVCPTGVQGFLTARSRRALTRGQRVRARAMTRGLAVHGVCTASQLRFQRGSKACVHGATCVQGVCARCVCPTGVQGFLTARSRRALTRGQRVRARALTRRLAAHGVCTASQLRFQRVPRRVCPTCVQGLLTARPSCALEKWTGRRMCEFRGLIMDDRNNRFKPEPG